MNGEGMNLSEQDVDEALKGLKVKDVPVEKVDLESSFRLANPDAEETTHTEVAELLEKHGIAPVEQGYVELAKDTQEYVEGEHNN